MISSSRIPVVNVRTARAGIRGKGYLSLSQSLDVLWICTVERSMYNGQPNGFSDWIGGDVTRKRCASIW